jgi:hypothetical protein
VLQPRNIVLFTALITSQGRKEKETRKKKGKKHARKE